MPNFLSQSNRSASDMADLDPDRFTLRQVDPSGWPSSPTDAASTADVSLTVRAYDHACLGPSPPSIQGTERRRNALPALLLSLSVAYPGVDQPDSPEPRSREPGNATLLIASLTKPVRAAPSNAPT